MRSLYSFIVTPKEERYTNTKKINDTELILNTEIQNHQYVSREGIVLETPMAEKTGIQKGDTVIVHHNVFRRFHDIRGEEVNSKSYFEEDKYFVYSDQIFLYKRNKKWYAPEGYCFVQPIKNTNSFDTNPEKPLIGILKYADKTLLANGIKEGDLVGFKPNSEYEFIIDGKRLYRVLTKLITIKYEYQGDEEEYNPSWLQSG